MEPRSEVQGAALRVLVTGGTGFIGSHLVDHLARQGHSCVVLVREDPARYSPQAGTEYRPYSELPQISGIDGVVNLAGESIAGRWTRSKKRGILTSRLETTRKLVDWMRSQSVPPSVFLSGSAVGIYGARPNEVLTEASSLDAQCRFRYTVCHRWEGAALDASPLGVRTVCLRIGNVLDPSGGILGTLASKLRWAPFLLRVSPHTLMPWISLADAVRLIEFALTDERVQGPLNITAPEPITLEEFVQTVGGLLGRPVRGTLPDWALKLALGEFSAAVLDSQDVRPARAMELGFTFGCRA